MRAGDLVGDRFEFIQLAGSGGMSEVFQARDRATGEPVAVKVLLEGPGQDAARFEREARVLFDIRHPGIVRYVAHGATPDGEPYLVMEWLEGEDLQSRLKRETLSVGEAVALGSRVAEALAAAHDRGVIHRDLKPSNLFLVDRSPEHVKVLDFGIARRGETARMTKTGAMIGTPGYMAPEQARGDVALTAGVDIFALGCVLFECLAGIPVFRGENLLAVLAKILFPETPRVIDHRPNVPAALDGLIDRMLARDPSKRPHHAAVVAAELHALRAAALRAERAPDRLVASSRMRSLTEGEQRLLSVVLISNEEPCDFGASPAADVPALAERHFQNAAEVYGGQLEVLRDGSMAVTIAGSGVATDQAARAARCALFLRALSAGQPIALATGKGELTGKLPLGDAIDRAAKRLGRVPFSADSPRKPGDPLPPIAIDDVTAGLLDARFHVQQGEGGYLLHGEHDLAEGARMLLGRPSPCVGRDRELGTVGSVFAECIDEPRAAAVLITAQAGIGKSRLAHEFVRGVRRHSEEIEIWAARGDSSRAGSAFGLLGQAIRGACGILDGEPLGTRQEKLCSRVKRHVAPAGHKRVSEFLGEIIGTPLPDEDSAPLRAARQDPQLMGQQMQSAWEYFLRAECAAHPVLLVLEDLHWGDLPTVRFVDVALRSLHNQPFMVLALARPSVHDLFPKLWAGRSMQEIHLNELTRKASERLVRQVLGHSVDPRVLKRLLDQAAGHAFYLEELIRAAAEGKGESLPETVVAMVQSRLEGLESDARWILRAASVFGEVFWQGSVASLVGYALSPERTAGWLSALAERELLVGRLESRFPGEPEFAFRHAFLREGAYAMLTDEDLILGHRLAGEWLEQHGESDPTLLAEHFQRGKEPARAAVYHLRAAEQALRAGDMDAAIACAQKGAGCGVVDHVQVGLLTLLTDAYGWRGNFETSVTYADEAAQLSTPGSATWIKVMSVKLAGELYQGKLEEFKVTSSAILRQDLSCDDAATLSRVLFTTTHMLTNCLQIELAEAIVYRLHRMAEPIAESDPIARGFLNLTGAFWNGQIQENPWFGLRSGQIARESFQEANHNPYALTSRLSVALNYSFLGAFAQAQHEIDTMVVPKDEYAMLSAGRTRALAEVRMNRGALDEARVLANSLVESTRSRQIGPYEGQGHWILAEVFRRSGDLIASEHEALVALGLLFPLDRLPATMTLAAVQLAQGRIPEALATADKTMAQYEAARATGYRGAFARLVHAECLQAAGHQDAACNAIAAARNRLLANADKIGDPELCRSFLENVPEHVRTFELAQKWLGDLKSLRSGVGGR